MDSLIEKFYLMSSIFKYYNIVPYLYLMVNHHKKNKTEINRRRENREKAWKKYDELKKNLEIILINIKKKVRKFKKINSKS